MSLLKADEADPVWQDDDAAADDAAANGTAAAIGSRRAFLSAAWKLNYEVALVAVVIRILATAAQVHLN